MKRIWRLIRRVWYTFYGFIVKNGQPVITGFFVFNADESKGDFLQIGAVCSTRDGRSCIGLDYTAGNAPDDDITLLLLHELTHVVLLQGEHDKKFEIFLDELISNYNREFETNVVNDYEGFTGSDEEVKMIIQNQRRADSLAVPTAWLEKLSRTDSKNAPQPKQKKSAARRETGMLKKRQKGPNSSSPRATAPRKRKQADDSSQSARLAMIRRMQQGGATAASEKSRIRKDFNGVYKG
ncbi:MAG: hypothetical protein LUE87_09365 [Lachnospiraceae bacterium]|nr:hypothetical protein [Lachnospiraceae bacterium]